MHRCLACFCNFWFRVFRSFEDDFISWNSPIRSLFGNTRWLWWETKQKQGFYFLVAILNLDQSVYNSPYEASTELCLGLLERSLKFFLIVEFVLRSPHKLQYDHGPHGPQIFKFEFLCHFTFDWPETMIRHEKVILMCPGSTVNSRLSLRTSESHQTWSRWKRMFWSLWRTKLKSIAITKSVLSTFCAIFTKPMTASSVDEKLWYGFPFNIPPFAG